MALPARLYAVSPDVLVVVHVVREETEQTSGEPHFFLATCFAENSFVGLYLLCLSTRLGIPSPASFFGSAYSGESRRRGFPSVSQAKKGDTQQPQQQRRNGRAPRLSGREGDLPDALDVRVRPTKHDLFVDVCRFWVAIKEEKKAATYTFRQRPLVSK